MAVEPFPPPPRGWTCFHCGDTFRTVMEAAHHFGAGAKSTPACILKSERPILAALRQSETERDELEVRLTVARLGGTRDMENEAIERYRATRVMVGGKPLMSADSQTTRALAEQPDG